MKEKSQLGKNPFVGGVGDIVATCFALENAKKSYFLGNSYFKLRVCTQEADTLYSACLFCEASLSPQMASQEQGIIKLEEHGTLLKLSEKDCHGSTADFHRTAICQHKKVCFLLCECRTSSQSRNDVQQPIYPITPNTKLL